MLTHNRAPLTLTGTKAFLALRTNMFNVDREHITLEYLGAYPKWEDLIHKAEEWQKVFMGMPIPVRVNGYATWKTQSERFFKGALIEFPGLPEINYKKMWHITLESRHYPYLPQELQPVDYKEPEDLCDDIWIGYSDADNNKHWRRFMGVQTMIDGNPAETPF